MQVVNHAMSVLMKRKEEAKVREKEMFAENSSLIWGVNSFLGGS